MIVLLRNGGYYLYLPEVGADSVFMNTEGFMRIDNYNEDLDFPDDIDKEFDVMKVFQQWPYGALARLHSTNTIGGDDLPTLLWDRDYQEKPIDTLVQVKVNDSTIIERFVNLTQGDSLTVAINPLEHTQQ